MSEQLLIRIDKNLKNRLKKTSQSEGKASSQVVRELIEDYVATHDMSAYVDDLWDRIGTKLKKNFTVDDIDNIIKQVRKENR
ncbi:MAG: CopG family transcriptional regulator [Candidatus Marinimicrobia bacterium]|nr:CopG family transcriptional regulator [Candidatus Neomarinimicrobiota bacterium]MCH7763492.1 CopG family transcriptional regulator [Candidatus Neomarinimicrobiota bacterium]